MTKKMPVKVKVSFQGANDGYFDTILASDSLVKVILIVLL